MATKSTYIVRGSVRGTLYTGRSLSVALRTIRRDRAGCASQGGYSDVALYTDGEHTPVETDDDGHLVVAE